MEEGIVPGGGVAYIRAASQHRSKGKGQIGTNKPVWPSFAVPEAPIRTLTSNAGIDGSIVVQKIKDGKGDLASMPVQKNTKTFSKAGGIDPTKVKLRGTGKRSFYRRYAPHYRMCGGG